MVASIALIGLLSVVTPSPAMADGGTQDCTHCNIDYEKLNLTDSQKTQIQKYDTEWFQEYQKTQPEIQDLQQQFKDLLASPKVEATEVMRVQQQIDQKRSGLKTKATQILIKKRRLLSSNQNKLLDNMIKEEISKRRLRATGENVVPVRWQKMLNNVTKIFPQGQE